MHAHDGVVALDRLTPHELPVAARLLGLWEAAVFGPQALEKHFQWLGKSFVCCGLRRPSRISAGFWDLEKSKESYPRRLVFVRDVGVVACGCQSGSAAPESIKIVLSEVDGVELDVIFYVGADRLYFLCQGLIYAVIQDRYRWLWMGKGTNMHVQPPKVLPKLLLLFWTNIFKILFSEYNNPPFCNEQSQFVFLCVTQLRELKACDFSSDLWRQLRGFDACIVFWEKIGLRWVGVMTTVVEVKKLCRWKGGCRVVDREISRVLGLTRSQVM